MVVLKKRVFITVICLALFTCALYLCYALKNKEKVSTDKLVYIDKYSEPLFEEDNYVLTSYEEYKKHFDKGTLSKKDFENNNYVVVSVGYYKWSESDIKPKSVEIDGKNIKVSFTYKASCGVCPLEYIYYLLKVDKELTDVNLKLDYKAVNNPGCDPHVSYKPMIYLYPEVDTKVTVKLGYPELLTTTYPVYKDKWEVSAKPNGDLVDENGRTFYGLYWEGLNNISNNFKDGFVVAKEDLVSFFEEKLEILGLNDKEANEFIVYWLPILEKNEYNLIRFESLDVINKEMPLNINPNPDTIVRVLMEYKPLEKPVSIKTQVLEKVSRKGFTVVEWGGTKLS